MKRIVVLIISVFICVAAYADGIEYFEHVKTLYQQGRYEEAKQGFLSCKTYYSEELNISSINKWISLCQSKINERNAAIQARRQAEIADAKRKADEAKIAKLNALKAAEDSIRKEKKLVYISSNAYIFDKEYTGMHQSIKGYIAQHSKQKYTNELNKAYWGIYITANAYKRKNNNNRFASDVIAYVTIKNLYSDEIIYEDEIIERAISTIDFNEAAKGSYKKINNKIANKIITLID